MPDLRAALKACPIAAILRGVKPNEIDAIGDALVEAGITIIEVPLNSPNPVESIKRLAARHGARALVGAGTVLEVADVARVSAAGGRLIVAPNFDADVVRATKAAGLASLPGVMTPSEGFAALKAGAAVFLSGATDDLLRRADYYCIATEVKVVVVHCCIQDSGNSASAQQQ